MTNSANPVPVPFWVAPRMTKWIVEHQQVAVPLTAA